MLAYLFTTLVPPILLSFVVVFVYNEVSNIHMSVRHHCSAYIAVSVVDCAWPYCDPVVVIRLVIKSIFD